MKRYILLFCTLIVAASLLILPASAAGYQITGTFSSGSFSVEGVPEPLAGSAVLTLSDNGELYTVDFILEAGTCATSFDGVPELGISLIEICFGSDNVVISCLDENYEPASVYCDFTLEYQVAEEPPKRNETVIAVSVFDVFAGVGTWIVTSLGSVSGIFWTEATGELTVLGVLAVAALGVAVVLGLVFIISRFLKFRS